MAWMWEESKWSMSMELPKPLTALSIRSQKSDKSCHLGRVPSRADNCGAAADVKFFCCIRVRPRDSDSIVASWGATVGAVWAGAVTFTTGAGKRVGWALNRACS